jgi:hypothetical protein
MAINIYVSSALFLLLISGPYGPESKFQVLGENPSQILYSYSFLFVCFSETDSAYHKPC